MELQDALHKMLLPLWIRESIPPELPYGLAKKGYLFLWANVPRLGISIEQSGLFYEYGKPCRGYRTLAVDSSP